MILTFDIAEEEEEKEIKEHFVMKTMAVEAETGRIIEGAIQRWA